VIEVVEFDKAGKFVRTLGGPGAVGVAVDPHEGDVFVAYPKFVEEFASEGVLRRGVGVAVRWAESRAGRRRGCRWQNRRSVRDR
jgi:hypothetical protein